MHLLWALARIFSCVVDARADDLNITIICTHGLSKIALGHNDQDSNMVLYVL